MIFTRIILFSFIGLQILLASQSRIESKGMLQNLKYDKRGYIQRTVFTNGLKILNQNNTLYGAFMYNKKEGEYYFLKDDQKKEPDIFGFYTTYNLFLIEANQTSDNNFQVKIDDTWKIIKNTPQLMYKSWNRFLKEDVLFMGSQQKMYATKEAKKFIVLKYEQNYSFKILKVEGDFVYAVCNKDCEGCGRTNKEISGWFRWKKGNEILIDIRLIC